MIKVYAIHGNGQDKRIFSVLENNRNLFEQKGLELCLLDLPGHGDAKRLSHYSIKAYTDSVTSVIEQNQQKCAVIGHSLGGHIALQAYLNAKFVIGIFSSGAPPLSNQHLGMAFLPNENIQAIYDEDPNPKMLNGFLKDSCNGDFSDLLESMFKRQDPLARVTFYQSLVSEGVFDEVKAIREMKEGLAYFLFGKEEKLANTDYVRSLELKNYFEIAGGHNLMLDNPKEYLKHVSLWLDEISQKS